ncbi:hypothetical protein OAS39_07820 [Pirellulales bacterium]|nr:hypothetical protein [Pirellulales bacterium]
MPYLLDRSPEKVLMMKSLRFTMRSLLVFLSCVAMASWTYWYGIPEYRLNRRQSELESALCALTAGPGNDFWKKLPKRAVPESITIKWGKDVEGNPIRVTPLSGDRYTYFVYCVLQQQYPSEQWSEVKIYRFPSMPSGYRGQTIHGQGFQRRIDTRSGKQYVWDHEKQYLGDCTAIMSGREKGDLGLPHELIHFHRTPDS